MTPYRLAAPSVAHTADLAGEDDPTRHGRRRAIAVSLVSASLLFVRFPLVFRVPPSFVCAAWVVASALQVVLAVAGAHWAFEARSDDRSRAQALCACVGATSVGVAVLGVLSTTLVTFVAWILGSIRWAPSG